MPSRRGQLLEKSGFDLGRVLRKGEPFIWLCGAALSLVVFAILCLMAVVLFEGTVHFWPKPVHKVTLKSGLVLAGMPKAEEQFEEKDEHGAVKRVVPRVQYFVANRDQGRQDFVWLDRAEIEKIEVEPNLLYLERQEWGPLIGYGEALWVDGKAIAVEPGALGSSLRAAVKDGLRRRKSIRDLERDRIGKVNDALEALRLKEKRGQVKVAGRRIELEQRYDLLKVELSKLENEDARFRVSFKTQQGETVNLPVSAMIRLTQPNALGLLGRWGVYFSRVFEFIFGEPRESNTEGGVFPAIFGTVLMTLMMSLMVVPLGVMTALYLREYAKQGWLVSAVRVAVNNLAGVPSIVFGVFGLGFFVYGLGGGIDRLFYSEALPTPTFGTGGILWASLTLALLTVPVVVVATEEALAFVPKGIRDGALACGATKWQMIRTVVLPAAAPGVLTGVILAMARGAGEVAPLMITGVVKLAPKLALDGAFPFFHPERKFMHLGFHIYDVGFQSPNVEAAMPMVYATTLLLIAVVVALNLVAMGLRQYLRNRYRSSGF